MMTLEEVSKAITEIREMDIGELMMDESKWDYLKTKLEQFNEIARICPFLLLLSMK